MQHLTKHPRALLFGLSISVFISALNISMASVALPTLVNELHTSFLLVKWVILSYLLILTVLSVSAGSLGDIIGKKLLYLGGLVVLCAGSLACSFAANIYALIAFRALQGIGAAVLMSLGFAVAQEHMKKEKIIQAITILTMTISLGFAAGPTIGGFLITWYGWQSIFAINLPFCVLSYILLRRSIPTAKEIQRVPFDYSGSFFLALALTGYIVSMSLGELYGFFSLPTWGVLSATACCLFIFIRVESRQIAPLLNLSLFRNPLISSCTFASICVYADIACTPLLASFFLAQISGLSATQLGLVLSVGPLTTALLGLFSGMMTKRVSPRLIMLLGILMMAAGDFSMATVTTEATSMDIVFRIALINGGLGLFQTPNNIVLMAAAKPDQRGLLSSLISLGRNLGHTTGNSVIGSIFGLLVIHASAAGLTVTEAQPDALLAGYHQAFIIVGVLMLVAAVAIHFGAKQGEDKLH